MLAHTSLLRRVTAASSATPQSHLLESLMGSFSIRASSYRFLLLRQLCSSSRGQKFSLAKLQSTDQVPRRNAVCPYNRVHETLEDPTVSQSSAEMQFPKESMACLKASPSASAAADGKRTGIVWWGPDATTGTWTPSTSAETMTNVISSPGSVLNEDTYTTASAFWSREDVHL